MRYRPEIDGLRAVAVLGVVLEGVRAPNPHRRAACATSQTSFFAWLEEHPEIETVVMAGRWIAGFTGERPESGERFDLADDETTAVSPQETRRVFQRGLQKSLARLDELQRRVVLVGPAPEPGFDVPVYLALAAHREIDPPVFTLRAAIEDVLENATDEYWAIHPAFCEADCRTQNQGVSLYSDDDHHLSVAGAEYLGRWLQDQQRTIN